MCLAIPGQIEALFVKNDLQMAKVNFGGICRETCLEYVSRPEVGDYVLVHVGFAIGVIDAEEAKRAYDMLRMSDEAFKDKSLVGREDEVS